MPNVLSLLASVLLLQASTPALPPELAEGLGPLGPLTVKSAVPAEGIEGAHARAKAMIQKAAVADVFEDATVGAVAAVRHKQSGLVCGFSGDARDNVQVYPTAPRGSDVVCNSWRGQELDSLYFTKLPAGATTEQAFGLVMRDLQRNHADMQPAKGAFANGNSRDPAVAAHMTARFVFTTEHGPTFGRTSVAMIDGWMVQQRVSAPIADQASADNRAELDFTMELALMPKLGGAHP